jgi:hypothetical protein
MYQMFVGQEMNVTAIARETEPQGIAFLATHRMEGVYTQNPCRECNRGMSRQLKLDPKFFVG